MVIRKGSQWIHLQFCPRASPHAPRLHKHPLKGSCGASQLGVTVEWAQGRRSLTATYLVNEQNRQEDLPEVEMGISYRREDSAESPNQLIKRAVGRWFVRNGGQACAYQPS
jgi:hypothetical protein